MFTKGKGLGKEDLSKKKEESMANPPIDFNNFEPVDHGNAKAPAEERPVSSSQVLHLCVVFLSYCCASDLSLVVHA